MTGDWRFAGRRSSIFDVIHTLLPSITSSRSLNAFLPLNPIYSLPIGLYAIFTDKPQHRRPAARPGKNGRRSKAFGNRVSLNQSWAQAYHLSGDEESACRSTFVVPIDMSQPERRRIGWSEHCGGKDRNSLSMGWWHMILSKSRSR